MDPINRITITSESGVERSWTRHPDDRYAWKQDHSDNGVSHFTVLGTIARVLIETPVILAFEETAHVGSQ
jgi:hypothetical protein